MRYELAFCLVTSFSLHGQSQPSRVDEVSKAKDSVPAFSSSGPVSLPVVNVQLDIDYPKGQKERGAGLLVIFDPQYRHYMWLHAEPLPQSAPKSAHGAKEIIQSGGGEAIYADTAGLIHFEFPNGFFVQVFNKNADSLDAAEALAIDDIKGGIGRFEGGGYYQSRKGLDIRQVIPDGNFSCAPTSSKCQYQLNTIQLVEKQPSGWRLILRNRWDQEVILDQQFNVISSKQLTQPK